MGETTKVVSVDKLSIAITFVLAIIFLHEDFTFKSVVGVSLITIGTLVMIW